jgi:repressor LexA
MMDDRLIFTKNLNQYMKINGKTQSDVALDLDIPLTTFSNWINGHKYPRIENLSRLAQYFGVTVTDLIGNGTREGVPETTRISVYSQLHWDGTKLSMKILNVIEEIPHRLSRTGSFFGLKMDDNSMSPKIDEDDICIVHETQTVHSGDVVVLCLGNDKAIVRRIKFTDFGISLSSFNPNLEVLLFTHEQAKAIPMRIIGKVVEVRRKF